MPRARTATPQAPTVQTTITMPQPEKPERAAPNPEKPDFWTYMQQLSPEEWKDHIVYVTRDEPKTSINGLGGYLFKTVTPFDIEDIKLAYGGRVFSYIMKRKNDLIYSGKFQIEAPPRFDPQRESAGTAPQGAGQGTANGSDSIITQFVNVLREELAHAREQGGAQNPATERALDLLTEASRKAMETVTKQLPPAQTPITQFKEMAEAMAAMNGRSGSTSTLGSLIGELKPLIELLTPVLGKFFTPSDPLSQVTQFMSLMDKLDELRGKAGGGGRGTTTNDLLLAGIEQLPKVLNEMGQQKAQALEHQQRQLAVGARTVSPGTSPVPPAGAHAAPPASAAAHAAQPQTRGGAATPPLSPLRVVPLSERSVAGGEHTAASTVGAVGAPTNLSPSVSYNPDVPLKEQYDEWVKVRIAEMIAMGFPGEQIAASLDVWKPEMIRELAQRSEQEIEAIFSLDPVLAQVVKHPNCRPAITAAKAEAEAILEDAEEAGDGVPEKVM